MNKEINFSFGDRARPSDSCGVTFKNEYYLFGGDWQFNRQVHKRLSLIIIKSKNLFWFIFKVLKVIGCRLERIMELDFDFGYSEACATYNIQNEEKVMLCFASDSEKRCDWWVYFQYTIDSHINIS